MPEKETMERAREDAREGMRQARRLENSFARKSPYPRREARSRLDKAGDCDRFIEGQASRSETRAASQTQDIFRHKKKSKSRLRTRPEPFHAQAFSEAVARDEQGFKEEGTFGSFQNFAIAASKICGEKTQRVVTSSGC